MAAIKGYDRAADGIPVEVKLDNDGYFPAFLMDIINDEALIRFPYNWMPEDKYNFSSVRFPPVESTERSDLQEKMIAEVLINKHQGFHQGWFKCCIQMLKSEFCQFEYLDVQNSSDFGYICNLRKPNTNPPISMSMLHVHKIIIPQNLREYAKCDNVHRSMKDFMKSALVNFDADHGELVIISQNITDISCAKVLEKDHLKALATKQRVLKRAEKINRKLEIAQLGRFTSQFTVPKSYVGWAIGKEKVHLRAAKNIKGVSFIQLIKNSNKFIIHGETEEAVKEARALLEIKIEPYPVLEEHMIQLVGKESANMYKFLEASGAVEIFIEDTKDALEEKKKGKNLPLYIIGTVQAIKKVKLFLQLQIDHICEVQRLHKKKFEITRQLAIFVGTDSRTEPRTENVVLPAQYTSTPKMRSFVNSAIYSMEDLEELENLNELLLEDYHDDTVNLDVILETNFVLGGNSSTDINLEKSTTRDTNQEDIDLVENASFGVKSDIGLHYQD